MLTRMDALTLAARSITYVAVAAAGQSSASSGFRDRGALLTPIAKVFASEAALEIASLNIQVHGGLGYVEERSEEHTSELQSLMRISYAVFCLKTKNYKHNTKFNTNIKTYTS